jgi:hypothetical protein
MASHFTGNLTLGNGSTTTLVGTITNNGTVLFDNLGGGIDVRLSGPVTLAGTGVFNLNDRPNNRIFSNSSGRSVDDR